MTNTSGEMLPQSVDTQVKKNLAQILSYKTTAKTMLAKFRSHHLKENHMGVDRIPVFGKLMVVLKRVKINY